MIYLKRITSLNNLNTGSIRGQIATILILITVALMIFILTTINLGRVSVKATQVANATDSATLYLASMLATRAHFLWERLDNSTEQCEKGGILSAVLGFVFAIISVVLIVVTGGLATPGLVALQSVGNALIITAAGTLGGFAGGYIQTGELKGAAMGAIQGFAIGAGFAAPGLLGSGTIALSSGANLVSIGGVPFLVVSTSGLLTGAVTGGLTAIGAGYIGRLQSDLVESKAENFASLYRGLKNLPEVEQARESVFLMALSQLVDDPNMENDRYDLDDDLDTDESVTSFENRWWERTLVKRGDVMSDNAATINSFFQDSLPPFLNSARDFVRRSDRGEVECNCLTSTPQDEGPISDFLRRIEACGDNTFWELGPSRQELIDYFYGCPGCIPSTVTGFDSFDAVRLEYEHIFEFVNKLLNVDDCGNFSVDIYDLERQIRPSAPEPSDPHPELGDEVWFNKFYDPDPLVTTDYYDKLYLLAHGVDRSGKPVFKSGKRVLGIQDWINQIRSIRDKLPGCQLTVGPYVEDTNNIVSEDCSGDYPTIFPCNWDKQINNAVGPHFPNPMCKLYNNAFANDNTKLRNEITTVRNFVNNLENHVKAMIRAAKPCGAGIPGVSGCWLNGINVTITGIRLDGIMHSPCDKTSLGTGQATITYSGTYNYSCKCCVNNNCCTVDPCCGVINGICQPCCVANKCCTQQTVRSGNISGSQSEQIAAPDLNIPNSTKANFLNTLTQFSNIVNGAGNTFATLDQDLGNEFSEIDNNLTDDYVPVLARLLAEIRAIDDFLADLKTFYDTINNAGVGNRSTYGGDTVTYCWHNWNHPDCPYKDENGDGIVPDYDAFGRIRYEDCHCVEVQTSNFRFPYLKKSHHESWGGLVEKDCVTIKSGSDEKNPTWVRVKRTDWGREKEIASSGKDLLGKDFLGLRWFPGKDKVDIERKSQADWDANKVGLKKLW
jgi:hypothetical protein